MRFQTDYQRLILSATAASIELERALNGHDWNSDVVLSLAKNLTEMVPEKGHIDFGSCLIMYHAFSTLKQLSLSSSVAELISAIRKLASEYESVCSQPDLISGKINYLRDTAVAIARAVEASVPIGER